MGSHLKTELTLIPQRQADEEEGPFGAVRPIVSEADRLHSTSTKASVYRTPPETPAALDANVAPARPPALSHQSHSISFLPSASRHSSGSAASGTVVNEKDLPGAVNGGAPGLTPGVASAPADKKIESDGFDDAFEVKWEENDPEHPHHWSSAYRWYLTLLGGMLVLNATFASSAPSGIAEDLMQYFGFSQEVMTLSVSLFVAGYCVGPILWGPLSEEIGRKPVFIVSFIFYTGFQVGCALSMNTASILVFRFLGGVFAASPLANSGALMGDIWGPKERGMAMAIFTVAPFAGPSLAPTVSGFIQVSGASWRWVFWVLTMFAGSCLIVIVFTLPETYEPVLLKRRAERKRKETGDSRWYAPIEMHKRTFSGEVDRILKKPVKVFFMEPLLIAVTIYMSFVYGCLYLEFEAYPIVFTKGHKMSAGISGLMFIPILVGGIVSCFVNIVFVNPRYIRLMDHHAPGPVPAEQRLYMALFAAPMFAASFFWFGWTSYPSISYWAPMMSGLMFGFSVNMIFLTLFNYILDTYLHESASALSANTVVRSAFGAGFPLFATQMFETLNPRWASTLLGCLAALMIPIPVLFMRYGHILRSRSKYSPHE